MVCYSDISALPVDELGNMAQPLCYECPFTFPHTHNGNYYLQSVYIV